MQRRRFLTLLLGTLHLLTVCALAETSDGIDYARDIAPLLASRCLGCHGPDEQEAGLRLDLRETALTAAESGQPAIVPGNTQQSELLRRIAATDDALRSAILAS